MKGGIGAWLDGFRRKAWYFAATSDLRMMSSSCDIEEARERARNRATLHGHCSVFRLHVSVITLVETWCDDGSRIAPLFDTMRPSQGASVTDRHTSKPERADTSERQTLLFSQATE